jgi:hypothetical protein
VIVGGTRSLLTGPIGAAGWCTVIVVATTAPSDAPPPGFESRTTNEPSVPGTALFRSGTFTTFDSSPGANVRVPETVL